MTARFGTSIYFFSSVTSIIYCFTGDSRVLYVGMILVPLLGFGVPHLQNFILKAFTSLIFGFDFSKISYEEQSYQYEKALDAMKGEKNF